MKSLTGHTETDDETEGVVDEAEEVSIDEEAVEVEVAEAAE